MLFFQLRVVLLLSFFSVVFFVFSRCGAFVWCSRPLFSDWRFHVCVCFQECFDIDLIGDLLCDFDW